ncbi:MAG: phosphoethanolamine--lipid A transferase [Magnetococcales bacterium]|nr:phosphoethanolamine--lipid A transferase [Magnetococcales bacterium]NGZ25335.1 phosphoethanolamine--lipid A transferase [Magnetococcales bacterium]
MRNVRNRSMVPWSLPDWLLSPLLAACFLGFYNQRFWLELAGATATSSDNPRLFMLALTTAIFLLLTAAIHLFSIPYVYKLVLVPVIILSAAASHFCDAYGVYITRDMMRNVFATDPMEAGDLLTWPLGWRLLLWGIIPAWILIKLPVSHPEDLAGYGRKILILLVLPLLAAGVVLGDYSQFAAFFRNNRQVKHVLIPSNYLYATTSYFNRLYQNKNRTLVRIGVDVGKPKNPVMPRLPVLAVVVVGETARGQNFSLAGYGRTTNPRLSQVKDLLYFNNVSSCGTDTAISLPCMFSLFDRDEYDADKAKYQENVLDVIQRAGVRVVWLENQSGCKGVCDRVAQNILTHKQDPTYCSTGECHDEILLQALEQILTDTPRDTLVVLHQMGSHGPAYYKRYPSKFEQFTPVCQSADLNKCSRQEIVNAYDNTLLYTDHVLASVIELLQVQENRYESLMLYVSDHGESLGENNLYLHGIPYALAPQEQTKVPMVMWLSEGYRRDFAVDFGHLSRQRETPWSHDHLFSTLMGFFNLASQVYRPQMDILTGSRKAAPVTDPGNDIPRKP